MKILKRNFIRAASIASVLMFNTAALAKDIDPTQMRNSDTKKQEHQRVLFIGNSFSFYNNGIHNHLSSLLRGANEWQKGQHRMRLMTLSGGHIHEHAASLEGVLSSDEQFWQTIVLQAHSNEAISANKKAQYSRSIAKAISEIKASNIRPILFMTWGYKGDYEMSLQLSKAYAQTSKQNDVSLVPVGLAFLLAQQTLPSIELFVPDVLGVTSDNELSYRKDWKHPSVAGTYLAACVFYASLYQRSPQGNIFHAGLSTENAHALQALAWKVVSQYNN